LRDFFVGERSQAFAHVDTGIPGMARLVLQTQ
jgi:hypothetical protein